MVITFAILFALSQNEPEGSPEQRLQWKLSKAFEQAGAVDASLIADAKSSPSFGTRYVALVVQIKEALGARGRHECTYQKIVTMSPNGGPPGAAEHLRALATSFKAAVYCHDCKDGKVVCGQCQGKKRTDVKCLVCEGKGRVGAPGAVDKTAVTMKCRNCDGKQVFRDVRCPGCSGTGVVDCPGCLGSPWHDRACTVKECRGGRVPCSQCKGKGKVEVTCPTCQGRGQLKTAQTICYEILRELVRESRQFDAREFRILASQKVIDMFLDEESQSLAMLEEFISKPISLQVETIYTQEQYDIVLM
jgi:hypothetical protein